MRLLSSGYLGIGTASPSSELEVNGTVTATSVTASTFTGNVTGNLTGNAQLEILVVVLEFMTHLPQLVQQYQLI